MPAPFSALQRAEIAEIRPRKIARGDDYRAFSALQRAEIAEILQVERFDVVALSLSVLFNEPKLLKSAPAPVAPREDGVLSVLFNEPKLLKLLRNVYRLVIK